MESPATWNRLTACLAANTLADADATWAVLVAQRVVDPAVPDARAVFDRELRRVLDDGEITGPSMPRRVALALEHHGLATSLAAQPDPWANLTRQALAKP